ncbi:MAG: hypothetical protein IMZ65_02520 [Planctomycetes bacterium]|nr:hypothetical protein [Planctomycetota bacterium]
MEPLAAKVGAGTLRGPAWWPGLLMLAALALAVPAMPLAGGEADPFDNLEPPPQPPQPAPAQDMNLPKPEAAEPAAGDWTQRFFRENFTFKKEIMSQVSYGDEWYSRQSVGGEILKKFSTATATVAAVNAQMRLVRRDNPIEVMNDHEGMDREGWYVEYHNLYLDLYNVLNPVLSDEAKGAHLGRFNVRAGRFYLPMGLNLQTDTHATVLQLSNDRNFGFERDWYTGLWGALNEYLNYDLYYLAGSGYHFSTKGQDGLLGVRLSLADSFDVAHGLQGGVAFMGGERLSKAAVARSPSVAARADDGEVVDTLRVGLDGRVRRPVPTGWLTLTAEVTGGHDEADDVFTQLYQAEYLHRSRRLGLATQYRRFWQDIGRGLAPPGQRLPDSADASVAFDVTWYFRNDVTGANLHWIRLNVEQQLDRQEGDLDTVVTLQYYRYW